MPGVNAGSAASTGMLGGVESSGVAGNELAENALPSYTGVPGTRDRARTNSSAEGHGGIVIGVSVSTAAFSLVNAMPFALRYRL